MREVDSDVAYFQEKIMIMPDVKEGTMPIRMNAHILKKNFCKNRF